MSRPLRVLHTLPDLALGGGQRVVLRHVRAADPGRVEHHVAFFGPDDTLAAELQAAGARLHPIPHRGMGSAVSALRGLRRVAHRWEIDVVQTHGTAVDHLYGAALALTADVPLVRTLHGMRSERGGLSLRPRPLLRRLGRELDEGLRRVIDPRVVRRFVAVSEAVRDDWSPYLRATGIPSTRVEVIPNGLPLEEHPAPDSGSRAAARARLGLSDDEPVLMTVSRLDRDKNVAQLVGVMTAVWRVFPRAVLIIVGDGPERSRIEAAVAGAELNGAVRFLGRRSDVPRILPAADLFLFASLREGFGLVVLEALASELPVIAFDLAPLRSLVGDDGAVTLVPPGRADRMAAAALAQLAAPQAMRERGRRGRALVASRFDVRRSASRYEALYAAVVAEAHGAGSR